MMRYKLENRTDLLEQLSAALKAHDDGTALCDLYAAFFQEDVFICSGSFSWALDCVVNDIFWDERCDWHEADEVRVQTGLFSEEDEEDARRRGEED